MSLNFVRRKSITTVIEKGLGGRHSDSGLNVTVFGASGLIGRSLVNRFGREGTHVVIPHRRPDLHMIHYKPMADLGQFNLVDFYDIRDDAATKLLIQQADVVVNCIGRDYNTRNFKMDEVNAIWPGKLAKMCKDAGVPRFIHLSALNASKQAPDEFLRKKATGEELVRQSYPEAIIIRPALTYGDGDFYFRAFRDLPRLSGNYLIGGCFGEPMVKAPITVMDVAQAVCNACKLPKIEGNTYELLGPESYTLFDLYDYLRDLIIASGPQREFQVREVPKQFLIALAHVYEMISYNFGRPSTSISMMRRIHLDEFSSGLPGLAELGVHTPVKLESHALEVLRWSRKWENFQVTTDETPLPNQYVAPEKVLKKTVFDV